MRLFLRVVRLLSLPAMPKAVRVAEGLALVGALAAVRWSLDDPDAAGFLAFALLGPLAALGCAMRAAALAARADHHELLRLVVGPGPLVVGLVLNAATRPLLLFLLPVTALAAWGAGEGRLSLPVFLALMACVSGLVGGLALGGRNPDPGAASRWAMCWHALPYGVALFAAASPAVAPVLAWDGAVRLDVLPGAASLMLLHVGVALLLPAHRPPPRVRIPLRDLGCLFGALLAMVIVVATLMPCRLDRRQGQFTACKSNLKNLGTALEMYSTDAAGRYPARLDLLSPTYLEVLPTCPSAGKVTYREGFATAVGPDAYTVVCTGLNHQDVGAPAHYPQYNSVQGILEK